MSDQTKPAYKTFRCWAPDAGMDEASGEDVTVYSFAHAEEAAASFHECLNVARGGRGHSPLLTVHVRDGAAVRVFESETRYECHAREKSQ